MQNGAKLVHELTTRDTFTQLTIAQISHITHHCSNLGWFIIFLPMVGQSELSHTKVHMNEWCIDEYTFFVCAYPYINQGGEHMLIILFLNLFFAPHPP